VSVTGGAKSKSNILSPPNKNYVPRPKMGPKSSVLEIFWEKMLVIFLEKSSGVFFGEKTY
jgi:hypothetical protein